MMKKIASLALIIALLLCGTAFADSLTDLQIDVDFEGEWWDVQNYGFSLYLPGDWDEVEETPADFAVGAADGSQGVEVTIIANDENHDLNALYESAVADADFADAQMVSINDFPFLLYTAEEGTRFNAMTLTEDGQTAILFSFTPNEEAANELATKILASLIELDMDAVNDDSDWVDGDD